jgi:hypothetical protein
MKKIAIIIIHLFLVNYLYSQNINNKTTNVLRINIINPGVEFEMAVMNHSAFVANLGVGYGGSYPNLSSSANGFVYSLVPFLDLQYRNYYNFEKRLSKGKNIESNSGNFWGLRMLTRGEAFASNFSRTSNYDFAFSPVWGLQRKYGKINVLFDIGPIYYFDLKGNDGIFPIIFEFSLGYNLN